MTPLELLQKTMDTVEARGACYGESEASLADIAAYWDVYLMQMGTRSIGPRDVALMLLLMKMARVRGSPNHTDNYIDMAGYAALAGNLAHVFAKDQRPDR